jgi:hypothetical protein
MSQRECAGFNAPRFSIGAGDKVEVSPRANETCRPNKPLIGVFSNVLPASLWSRLVGVAHPATVCKLSPLAPRVPSPVELFALGEGHPAKLAACANVSPKPFPLPFRSLHAARLASILSGSLSPNSPALGVGHPVEALSKVRRPDAVCAQYNRPTGVTFSFQVCEYSIEPSVPNRAFNLLPKDCVRAALADKPKPFGP